MDYKQLKVALFMKKILTLVIIAIFFAFVPVFAAEKNDTPKMARVFINKLTNSTYALNVYFSSEYRNKAFIQQIDNGHYIIYLPEVNPKVHTPIIYEDSSDKNRIKLNIDKRPFVEKGKTSNYTRIIVNMNADYSIKVISKLQNEDRLLLLTKSLKNSQNIIFLVVFGLIFILLNKLFRIAKSVNKRSGYIYIPTNSFISDEELKEFPIGDEKLKKYVTQKSTNQLKTANRNSFQSFDLNNTEKNQIPTNMVQKKNANRDAKMQQASQERKRIQNTNTVSNPDSQNNRKQIADLQKISELKINKINIHNEEEKLQKQEEKPVIAEQKQPDILSRINISSGKGLYLAAEGDIIALYGFNSGNNVLLKKFRDLSQLNLQARFFDNSEDGDVYIVRIDEYKSMIAFKDNSIRELVVL